MHTDKELGRHEHTCIWCGTIYSCCISHENNTRPTSTCYECRRLPFSEVWRRWGLPKAAPTRVAAMDDDL